MEEKVLDGTEAEEIISKEEATEECEICGGELRYEPYKKVLVCKFCAHEQAIKRTRKNVEEINISKLNKLFADTDWGVETKIVECKNCGGKTVSETIQKTTYCVFCGSQHVVTNEESAGVRPQGLVPFELDETEAKKRMSRWIKRRWLAPNDLSEGIMIKDTKSVYIPYWTFDSLTKSNYSIDVGVVYKDHRGHYRTRWVNETGSIQKRYNDFLRVGSNTKIDHILRRIEPFRTKSDEVIDYEPSYLVGCMARKYTIEPNIAWDEFKEEVYDDLELTVKVSVGAIKYKNFFQNIEYNESSFKYIMLPVYITTYKYRNSFYTMVVNGQTKKVDGTFPTSIYKTTAIIGIPSLIILIYFILLNYYF